MNTTQFNNILSSNEFQNDLILDDSARLQNRDTLWKRITHFRENRELDRKINDEVVSYFKERYQVEDPKIFRRIWHMVAEPAWNMSSPLTAGTLRAIDAMLARNLTFHGKGVEGPPIPYTGLEGRVHNFVRALIHGEKFPKGITEKSITNAILFKHDPALMKYFRDSLQAELTHHFEHPPQNQNDEFIWSAFIGNIIALLPFSYPETGTEFSIPRMKNGSCVLEKYTIEVIPLTYPYISSPMTALGMTPVDAPDAPNLLVFMGTTFPAGGGFAATIFSDFTPGHSVGELVYDKNKDKINGWLAGKKNVCGLGMSLGGAMVFHAIRNHSEQFTRAEVFSPPGLYPRDWNTEINKNCRVNIYTQKGDLVTQLGAFPTGSNISLYSILPHHEGIKENPLYAHIRVFSGCKKVTVIKEEPEIVNNRFSRILLTHLHQYIAPFAIFIPFGVSFLAFQFYKKVKKTIKHAISGS